MVSHASLVLSCHTHGVPWVFAMPSSPAGPLPLDLPGVFSAPQLPLPFRLSQVTSLLLSKGPTRSHFLTSGPSPSQGPGLSSLASSSPIFKHSPTFFLSHYTPAHGCSLQGLHAVYHELPSRILSSHSPPSSLAHRHLLRGITFPAPPQPSVPILTSHLVWETYSRYIGVLY